MYRFWVVKRGPVCLIGQHCVAFKKENSPIHLRGLAALVIWKVRVLWYEFTDVTLAWEDGQWVEAHKIILAGCSPNKSTPALMFELNGSYSDVQKTKMKTETGHVSGCPKLVLWMRQLKRGAWGIEPARRLNTSTSASSPAHWHIWNNRILNASWRFR